MSAVVAEYRIDLDPDFSRALSGVPSFYFIVQQSAVLFGKSNIAAIGPGARKGEVSSSQSDQNGEVCYSPGNVRAGWCRVKIDLSEIVPFWIKDPGSVSRKDLDIVPDGLSGFAILYSVINFGNCARRYGIQNDRSGCACK